MTENLYSYLAELGYHHPLHPALTHLPVGLTIGAFVFIALAWLLRQPRYAHTARHCTVLAFLAAIPTAILGYMDWQHFYGGTMLFPVQAKLVLASALLILLLLVAWNGLRREKATFFRLLAHLLCLVLVVCLGYFGGELVYGEKPAAAPAIETAGPAPEQETGQASVEKPAEQQKVANLASIEAGAALFAKKCGFCHFTESRDTKVGPGLKGLFDRETLLASGRPVSAENIRRQLIEPVAEMPAFKDLEEEEIRQLTDFLKTL